MVVVPYGRTYAERTTMNLRRDDRRGSQAVEFAMILPILFISIVGAMNYGWFFCHQLVIDECTEMAARSASIRLVDDATSFAASSWHTVGEQCWADFGLPGQASFTTAVRPSGSVFLVHVTGQAPFADFLAGGAGEMKVHDMGTNWTLLPQAVTSTSVKFTATQSFANISIQP